MFELTQEPSEKEGQMKEKPLGQRLKCDGHEGKELIIMMIMEAKNLWLWWSWRQRTYNYDDHEGKELIIMMIMEAKLVTITMTPSGVLCWRWWPTLYSWTSRSSSLLFFSSSPSSSSIWICQFLFLISWFNSSLGDDSFWRWDNQTQGEVWPTRRRNLQYSSSMRWQFFFFNIFWKDCSGGTR